MCPQHGGLGTRQAQFIFLSSIFPSSSLNWRKIGLASGGRAGVETGQPLPEAGPRVTPGPTPEAERRRTRHKQSDQRNQITNSRGFGCCPRRNWHFHERTLLEARPERVAQQAFLSRPTSARFGAQVSAPHFLGWQVCRLAKLKRGKHETRTAHCHTGKFDYPLSRRTRAGPCGTSSVAGSPRRQRTLVTAHFGWWRWHFMAIGKSRRRSCQRAFGNHNLRRRKQLRVRTRQRKQRFLDRWRGGQLDGTLAWRLSAGWIRGAVGRVALGHL